MRFLVIARRKDNVLKDATPEQVADHFTQIHDYFSDLHEQGFLAEHGRFVGEHAQLQLYDVSSRVALDVLLNCAPNTPFVEREIHEIGPFEETVNRLCTNAYGHQ